MRSLEVAADSAGFRFEFGAGQLGVVANGARTDIDFLLSRDQTGTLFLIPIRAGTLITDVGETADLTAIDLAPEAGYTRSAIEAQVQHGYVFQMDGGDGLARFGAIRVTHVGTDLIIFDWSYQTDPGNPELAIGGGVFAAASRGVVVKR